MKQPQIEKIDPSRRAEQIRLFNDTFHKDFTQEHWHIKHEQNPFADSSENLGIIDQGELVGFNLFMPQEYQVNQRRYLFLQSCESVIRADHRGHRYLGCILSGAEEALNPSYDLIYGTPNSRSRRTFEKLGYRFLYEMDSLFLPGSIRNVSAAVAGRLFGVQTRSHPDLDTLLAGAFAGSGVKISSTCPQNLNWVFDDNSGPIHICRSEAFYHWKIDSYTPPNQKRRYLYIEEEGEVKLFCVASFSTGRHTYVAQLLDLYVKPGERAYLKRLIRGLRKGCGFVKTVCPRQGRQRELLKHAGFLVHQKAVFPVMYKLLNPEATELAEAFAQEDSWSYSSIETDTVMN